MTTEVTIDEATAALIKKGADDARVSFQEAAATALRVGARTSYGGDQKQYEVSPHSFGNPMMNLKGIIAQVQEEDDLERIRRTSR